MTGLSDSEANELIRATWQLKAHSIMEGLRQNDSWRVEAPEVKRGRSLFDPPDLSVGVTGVAEAPYVRRIILTFRREPCELARGYTRIVCEDQVLQILERL